MDKIPNGGFPPLMQYIKKNKKHDKKNTNIERFYTTEKKININQILNNNTKNIFKIDNNDIEEINTL